MIGSRGSVLSSFRLQAQHHGEVNVRGETTSRFFMTEGEAASLVLSTLAQKEPDGTYVFEVGEPVEIIRLANAVIAEVGNQAEIRIVSLEPGEARHEKLFADDESPSNTSVPEVRRVEPPPLDRSLVRDRLASVDDLFDLEHDVARQLLEDLAAL